MKILRKALGDNTASPLECRALSHAHPWDSALEREDHISLKVPASQKVLTRALRRVKIIFSPPSGINATVIYQLTVLFGEP